MGSTLAIPGSVAQLVSASSLCNYPFWEVDMNYLGGSWFKPAQVHFLIPANLGGVCRCSCG